MKGLAALDHTIELVGQQKITFRNSYYTVKLYNFIRYQIRRQDDYYR